MSPLNQVSNTDADQRDARSGRRRYHVFLSHNRRDKPWVRKLWEFLCSVGLEVFFDCESIEPGANFVEAIGRALDGSERVVLVISKASLASRWVAMETALAVASESRIVPVLLEPIDESAVPPWLRFRQNVELFDTRSRDRELRRLLTSLGVDKNVERELPAWPVETLVVAGPAEVASWGWTAEQLVQELTRIDAEVYNGALEVDENISRDWARMFDDHPDSWRLVVDAPGQIIAYWHCVPLLGEDFDALMSGELVYGDMKAGHLAIVGVADRLDIYCSGICIQQRYRRPAVFKILFESLLDVLEQLAEAGVLFDRVGANAFSHQGESLCRSLGLLRVKAHPREGTLYKQDVRMLLERRLAAQRAKLVSSYQTRQLP